MLATHELPRLISEQSDDMAETPPKNTEPQILVVEDNITNQIFYEHALGQLGLNYHLVEDGQKAVDYWKTHDVDVILMDVSMPVLNGYQATEKIRVLEKVNQKGHTPIIGVSAHALKTHLDKALDVGMDDYMTKPVAVPVLKQKISKYLEDTEVSVKASA